MTTLPRLSVFASGMVTAVGFHASATCAAMRAGISGVAEENLWDPTAIKRLSAARPHTPQWWEGAEMLAELLAPAITQCLDALPRVLPSIDPKRVPIFVVVSPPDRPHRYPNLDDRVWSWLEHKLERSMPAGSRIVPAGRTGLAHAMFAAQAFFRNEVVEPFIVAGAESFLRQAIVRHYIESGRLLCGANSNGFIPGEAACAVLLGRQGLSSHSELRIEGMAVAHEPSGAGGDAQTPVTGAGLTDAMRRALQQAGIEYSALNFTISDLNGERFKFKEAAIAAARLDRLRAAGQPRRPLGYLDVWHPIEFLGEVGAAIAPCLLGWAFEAGRRGYAPGEHCLLFCGEDNGERLAIVTSFRG